MAFHLPGPLHDGECLSCLKLSDQVEAIRKERDDWESRCRDKWDANTLLRRELEELQENYSRESDLAYRFSQELDEAKKTIARLQHEKDDAVFRNKILRERPDLPIERIRAYDTIMETVKKAEEQLTQMKARKDGAYLERNQVVAALAKCFPSGVAKTAIEDWSEDWHGCVYIDLPIGQVSWHFHDSHAHLFDGLPAYTKPWDGHTTEEKYQRLSQLPIIRCADGG